MTNIYLDGHIDNASILGIEPWTYLKIAIKFYLLYVNEIKHGRKAETKQKKRVENMQTIVNAI